MDLDDDQRFEKVANLVLQDQYPGLRPTGPTGDLGRDGYDRSLFATTDDLVILTSLQKTWMAKLRRELRGIRSKPADQRPKRAIFVTNQSTKQENQVALKAEAARMGLDLEVFDLTNLDFLLSTDALHGVAEHELGVWPREPRLLVSPAEFYEQMGRSVPGVGAVVVGRNEVVARITAFATDVSPAAARILVVEGGGGVGKTRLAVDGATRAGLTLVAHPATRIDRAALTELPLTEPVVLVVDDAHRSPDLSGLAAMVGDSRYDRVRIILTVRPGLATATLRNAGLDRLIRRSEELAGLTRRDINAIVVGHGINDSVFIRAVMALAEGSPLIAHAACELTVRHQRFSWRDATDILDDLVVQRLLDPAGRAMRAAAVALAAAGAVSSGEDLTRLARAVTSLPTDAADLDDLLADLADVGIADTGPGGAHPVFTIRPHPLAPVLVAGALSGTSGVRLRIDRLLPVLGRSALRFTAGETGPVTAPTGGPLGIGQLVNDPSDGPWVQIPPLGSQLQVLAQAAVHAHDDQTAALLAQAVRDLLPAVAATGVWCDVLVLAEQVAPAAPTLLGELRTELVRQWPPPPSQSWWRTPPADHHRAELARVAEQVRALAFAAGDIAPADATGLLLTAAHLAAPFIDERRFTDVVGGIATLATPGGALGWESLIARREVVLAAIASWVSTHLPSPVVGAAPKPDIRTEAALLATTRTALAALRPFLTLLVEVRRMGSRESEDVVEMSAAVLPDHPRAMAGLTSAAAVVGALVAGLDVADPAAAGTVGELVALPRDLIGAGVRGQPHDGDPLPEYARTALAAAATTIRAAVAARWDVLPVWARHAAAVSSVTGDGTTLAQAAEAGDPVAARAAGDLDLTRLFVLLPPDTDRRAYLTGGTAWEEVTAAKMSAAVGLARELGWVAAIDLLEATRPVQDPFALTSYRVVFAAQVGELIDDPATPGALIRRLASSPGVPAEAELLGGLLRNQRRSTVDALQALCGTVRGVQLGLGVVWQLPADAAAATLDAAHGLLTRPTDAAADAPGAVELHAVGEQLAMALLHGSGELKTRMARLIALGMEGPPSLLPRVLQLTTYLLAHPGSDVDRLWASDPQLADLIAILRRRLELADDIPVDLNDDDQTGHAVAVLAVHAPAALADLAAARLLEPAPPTPRWPHAWREALDTVDGTGRAPFALALCTRVDAGLRAAPLDAAHAFDVDRLLARVSEGTDGWVDTVMGWAAGEPADRMRAVAAVAGGWRSAAWAPTVSRLLRSDLPPADRQALVGGIQVYDTGPDIADRVAERLAVLNELEPADHPLIRSFRTDVVRGLNATEEEYHRSSRTTPGRTI